MEKNINVKRWYEGLDIDEMKAVMVKLAKDTVFFVQKDLEKSDKLYDTFLVYFQEVIPAVCEEKTWYYGANEQAYQMWDKFHRELWAIRNDMESALYNALNEVNAYVCNQCNGIHEDSTVQCEYCGGDIRVVSRGDLSL